MNESHISGIRNLDVPGLLQELSEPTEKSIGTSLPLMFTPNELILIQKEAEKNLGITLSMGDIVEILRISSDILESVDRKDEPFESVGDVIEHITDGLNSQQFDISILDYNSIDYSIDWECAG
jgi:hypothetical protein